jgi:drug/metabolite transporter (DMT)-like permease
MSLIPLAIFLGILSYSMLNIGMGLQKKGAALLPKIEKQTVLQNLKNFFTNKFWVIGFILVQVQWVFLTMALDFASVSVVTPLMSFGMVALVIFAFFYLKEPIAKVEIAGIVAIIVGIVVLGVTNREDDSEYNLSFVLNRFSQVSSIIFLSMTFALSVFLVIFCIIRKFSNADILFSIAAGITDALGAIFIRALMSGADFFGNSGQNSGSQWTFWFIMVLMILLNGTATVYLQIAYQRGKATIVAPIFTVLAMITPVLGGVILFNEWKLYFDQNLHWLVVGKVLALIVISAGAAILSIHSARRRRFDGATEEKEVPSKVREEKKELEPQIVKSN